MPIQKLDHVNVLTARVDELSAWYEAVLGLKNGDRPNFPFPGAWIYAGDVAVVHLVGVEKEAQSIEPKIEHFAFTATDMAAFTANLDAHGVTYSTDPVPGLPITQINLRDPDGNHIHVDFNDPG